MQYLTSALFCSGKVEMKKKLIIVMGISGSGKSTLGKHLAEILGIPFLDADDFHPRKNVMKMSRGTPLKDDDRCPWLAAIGINFVIASHRNEYVLSCSAFEAILQRLFRSRTDNTYVYLSISEGAAIERMNQREGHFMKARMIKSQLATLEPPSNAIELIHTLDMKEQVAEILKHLALFIIVYFHFFASYHGRTSTHFCNRFWYCPTAITHHQV